MPDRHSKPPRIAVVGIPGKWSTEVLADALEARTGFRAVVDMAEVSLDLSRGALICSPPGYGELNLCDLDGIIVKKISAQYSPNTLDRLALLRTAEQAGVRVFSPVASMEGLVNRLHCTLALQHAAIPMPETFITESIDAALDAVTRFGGAVFKPLFSTKARGMLLLDSSDDPTALRNTIETFRSDNPLMYIQRKVELPGRDLGMVFLGGRYLGTYARVNQGDSWNTTINSGGRYAEVQPDPALIELGQRAQAPFNMDFTTVDIAETDCGPIVFEVSAFGGFRGALEGAGVDAAAHYADYALEQLTR
ncbi:GAK system ATP-grasp enzyme [Spongiibacter nanhainus]|uniref:GAK system ATP-grasp enzyme n=1 Tax=Spongiibacter nanhainus TaxID=2794344 RepID=A0A7T4QZM8_9GAMM|nr:GAK system ATP-grasp enzyme [Spongiibacter nanhainus]QQD17743.1 GAK system ATP-grasp enzyme [Spongiibacter nanhainus]